MELVISIISCIAAVGSLVVAIISLVKGNQTKKELHNLKNTYTNNSVKQNIKNNSGINVGLNGGVINEKE